MERIASGIWQIDTKPLGHEQIIACYLVRSGAATALIDPGFPVSAEVVAAELAEEGIDVAELDHIILTHSHIDHAGAAGILAAAGDKATVVCHERGSFYLRNAAKIRGGSSMVFGLELAELLGEPKDVPSERIRIVSDGDVIEVGDKRLRVYYTPGHSGDHISLFEECGRVLFPGDTACLHYPHLAHGLIPAGSPPIYRADAVVGELRELVGLEPELVMTPHYGAPSDAPADFLQRNIDTVERVRKEIQAMFKRGLDFSQVVEELRQEILAGVGQKPPDFLSDVWLRAMLRTGLMGYMADILEYARDLRPFSEPAGSTSTP